MWCALFEKYCLQTGKPDSRFINGFERTTSTASLFSIDEPELFNFSDEVSHDACHFAFIYIAII